MTSGTSHASQEQVGPQVWAAHKLKASHKVTDTHTAPPTHTPTFHGMWQLSEIHISMSINICFMDLCYMELKGFPRNRPSIHKIQGGQQLKSCSP